MMRRILIFLALLVVFAVIFYAASRNPSSTSGTPTTPQPTVTVITPPPAPQPPPPFAPQPVPVACTIPNDAATLQAIGPNVTGGVFRAPNLIIPANVTLNLTRDLIIITNQALTVNGTITYAVGPNGVTNPDAKIILASQTGNVTIGPNALVGKNAAALLPTQPAVQGRNAVGPAGKTASNIVIISALAIIHNQGTIAGMHGQSGAVAKDIVPNQQVINGVASGGRGGNGAHVYLCAMEGIINDNRVESGGGGDGGSGAAIGGDTSKGTAVGGPGGRSGDVILVGLAQGNPVPVMNNMDILGNLGGSGGAGIATGGQDGGSGLAQGASSGIGGTVQFINAVMNPVGNLQVGSGGDGGLANAKGSRGAQGGNGGDADATGGRGAADGAMPVIPVPPGQPAGVWGPVRVINPGKTGKGGDAKAKAGAGGGAPGVAGTQTATGGVGKSGAPPGAPVPGPIGDIISTGSP